MSKAFTKEDDGSAEVIARPIVSPGERRPITREGLRQLEAQLGALGGDSSPDAEARRRQLIATLELVDPHDTVADPEGRVVFGAWVRVEEEDGTERRYRLVGPDEADVKSGLISVQSPLARALIGTRAGDTVEVHRPLGEVELTVLSVAYEEP